MGDIALALTAIKTNLPLRQEYIDYFDGKHKLAFATDKFQSAFGKTLKGLRDNLCPIVVTAPADRMEVINFAGDKSEVASAIANPAWELWQREQMELGSYNTHIEALKSGCAYLIVWPDRNNQSKFYLQDSRQCVIIEDEETGEPLFGAKLWDTDVTINEKVEKFTRITLYYADRIEKYITAKKKTESVELKEKHFVPVQRTAESGAVIEAPITPNPYGIIPMFSFETDAILEDAIPLQDSINKTFADRMVTQEFGSFRQRWITGFQPDIDPVTGTPQKVFNHGIDKLWFANDKDVKFGDFAATDIEPFLKASNEDKISMARVTGTPLHFFGLSSDHVPSGEALKTLESRFTKRVKRLCLNFGAVWARVMKLALAIESEGGADNLTVQWDTPEQRSEKEMLDSATVKKNLGIPEETLWEELGYSEEDIAKFTKAKEQAAKDALELARSQPKTEAVSA